MILSVDVAGFPFEAHHTDRTAREGAAIKPGGFVGIEDGVDVRRTSQDRPGAHGAFDAQGYLDARVMTINATIRTPSAAQTRARCLQLSGLLADGELGLVTVTRESDVLSAWGRLASKTKAVVRGAAPRYADAQLQMWFANPRLYGETRHFTGGQLAFHRGNFPASPRLTVTGSAPGYTVFGPDGKQIVVTRTLVAGAPHVIDLADGSLRVGGARVFGGLARADLWTIPSGGTAAQSVSAGALDVEVVDTFI